MCFSQHELASSKSTLTKTASLDLILTAHEIFLVGLGSYFSSQPEWQRMSLKSATTLYREIAELLLCEREVIKVRAAKEMSIIQRSCMHEPAIIAAAEKHASYWFSSMLLHKMIITCEAICPKADQEIQEEKTRMEINIQKAWQKAQQNGVFFDEADARLNAEREMVQNIYRMMKRHRPGNDTFRRNDFCTKQAWGTLKSSAFIANLFRLMCLDRESREDIFTWFLVEM